MRILGVGLVGMDADMGVWWEEEALSFDWLVD